MKIRFSFSKFILSLLFTLMVIYPGIAQGDDCPELVRWALQSVEVACADLGRNEACYGNNRIEASFNQDAEIKFEQPADRVGVGQINTLRTFGLDESLGIWGVALLNIQANLPETLPGQTVKFILYGDVSLENSGADQSAVPGVCPITINTAYRLRSGPGANFNVWGNLAAGAEFQAEGRNEAGDWLYINQNGLSGWVAASSAITACDVMQDLSVYDPEAAPQYGPMQAFYFTTGGAQPACAEAPPSTLLIQSPEGFRVTLNANGMDLSVGSSVALTASPGEQMTIATLDGDVWATYDGETQRIPEGFEASVELGGEDGLTPEGAPESANLFDDEQWDTLAEATNTIYDESLDIPDTDAWTDLKAYCDDPANAEFCADPQVLNSFDLGYCGDAVCDASNGEDSATCEQDCSANPVCGDFLCDPSVGEDSETCSSDCAPVSTSGCGDAVCEAEGGEDADTCPSDCAISQSSCGDFVCDNNEDVSSCPTDCASSSSSPVCGDAVCESGEDPYNCSTDCGAPPPVCGDAVCESGEDSDSCPSDCS